MATPRGTPTPTVLTTGSVASEVSLLFRTKRVSEIRAIEAQIRAEAEEKSDSLRELLGTRYKDLLQAADEMAAARDACSGSVRDALRTLSTSASELREHFMRKGARDLPAASVATDDLDRRKKLHVVGGKLKHIVDSPEVLYAHLESGDVYDAAVRYALAERNYAELRDTTGLEGVANRFAEQRWKQVQVFREQILSAGEKKLITPNLEASAYSRVLAALVIVSGKARDIVAVLEGMLASRTGWIDDENKNSGESVSIRLRKVAEVVHNVIASMKTIFWTEDGDSVEALLRNVDESAADELAKLRDDGVLTSAALKWIDNVKAWLEEHGRNILIDADSSRVLADTLRAIDDVFSDETWPVTCQSTLDQPPKFVFDIFAPFISERAATVASQSVRRTAANAVSDFATAWDDLDVGRHAGKMIWSKISSQAVGWKSDPEDSSVQGTKEAKSAGAEEEEVSRALAFNGPIDRIICSFESSLRDALSDVTILTQRVPAVASAFDDSVHESLPLVLNELRKKLESIPESFNDDMGSKELSCDLLMEKSLVVTRLATALRTAQTIGSAYLFHSSISNDRAAKGSAKDAIIPNNEGLTAFHQAADKLCSAGYRTWANRLCLRLRAQLETELTNEKVLCVPTGWAASGREKDIEKTTPESGDDVGLRHPTTASTAVVNFVLAACKSANWAGGFALRDQAIQFLRQEMSQAAVLSFRKAITFYCGGTPEREPNDDGTERLETRGSDGAVMQMLFDVQVLQQLLQDSAVRAGPLDSKISLKAVERQLHALVDPIDLASCRKLMQEAVYGYSSRTSILFGTITRSHSGRSCYNKRPLSTSSQLASANLVSLSKTVSRFAYLPAPMPSTYSTATGGTAGMSAKAALGALRSEAASSNNSAYRKREAETSVAGYASKVSESVGRFGRGFFESLTRKVG